MIISVRVSYNPLETEEPEFWEKLVHKIHKPRYFFAGMGLVITGWLISLVILAGTGFGSWLNIAGSILFLITFYLLVLFFNNHFMVLLRELIEFKAGDDYLEFKKWNSFRRIELKQTKKIKISKDRKFKYLGLWAGCRLGRIEVETWQGEKLFFNLLLAFREEELPAAKKSFEQLVDYLGDHLYYRERTRLPER